MLDYWLSRMFYDLHTNTALAGEYRVDRDAVIARYPLGESVARAVRRDDAATLAPLTNPFLLRYYFLVAGVSDPNFIAALQANRKST